MFNDEDRDYGVLVLGVLAAVILLVVGWSTGMVPGNPAFDNKPVVVADSAAAGEDAEASGDIVEATKAALAAASVTGLTGDLGVELGDGADVIRLTGEVASEEIKIKAGEIAAEVPGVGSVDNQLTIGAAAEETVAAETLAAETAAAETAAAETSVAAAATAAPASLVATASEDGTVVLTGSVPSEEQKTSIADGIRSVLPAGSSLDNQLAIDPAVTLDGAGFQFAGKARPELFDAIGGVASAGLGGIPLTITNDVVAVEAPKLESELNALFAAEPIQFATASDVISPASLGTVDKAAALLIASPEGAVAIEGHSDNVGAEDRNIALSQRRADAVRSALIERSVDGARLTAKGYGPARPIADNSTPEGRQQNRRVEVVVTNG